jgi:hypothetical protein
MDFLSIEVTAPEQRFLRSDVGVRLCWMAFDACKNKYGAKYGIVEVCQNSIPDSKQILCEDQVLSLPCAILPSPSVAQGSRKNGMNRCEGKRKPLQDAKGISTHSKETFRPLSGTDK